MYSSVLCPLRVFSVHLNVLVMFLSVDELSVLCYSISCYSRGFVSLHYLFLGFFSPKMSQFSFYLLLFLSNTLNASSVWCLCSAMSWVITIAHPHRDACIDLCFVTMMIFVISPFLDLSSLSLFPSLATIVTMQLHLSRSFWWRNFPSKTYSVTRSRGGRGW